MRGNTATAKARHLAGVGAQLPLWVALSIAFLAAGCVAQGEGDDGDDGRNDVWGKDDRKERYEVSEAIRKLARSSVALVERTNMVEVEPGYWAMGGKPHGESQGLCPSERFRDQPEAANCSGTLVGKDLVLTSGHCVPEKDCSNVGVVFDFAYDAKPSNPKAPLIRLHKDVFFCKGVVAWNNTDSDYAVLRLDRAPTERAVLAVDWTQAPANGKETQLIGHPAGIPQKVSRGPLVEVTEDWISYHGDSQGGFSGGGVFVGGSLVGVHESSSGHTYVPAMENGKKCNKLAVCGVNVECPNLPTAASARGIVKRLPPAIRAELGH